MLKVEINTSKINKNEKAKKDDDTVKKSDMESFNLKITKLTEKIDEVQAKT